MRYRTFAALVVAAATIAVAVPAALANSDGEGELWLPSESGGKVYIVHGKGSVETMTASQIQKPHIVTFSAAGELAYVSDVGNGNLNIVDADDRTVAATISGSAFGGGPDTHQAKPSPDGSILFVARRALGGTLGKLFKVQAGTWSLLGNIDSTGFGGKFPICTVFSPDGAKAYVSLSSSGVAIVDVATMTVVGQRATNGGIACGMSLAKDGETVFITSNGGAGSTTGWFYRLDVDTDTISAGVPVLNSSDLHWNTQSPNGKRIFATARGSDSLKVLSPSGSLLETISLNATAGVLDSPDGADVKGNNVYVVLKDTGKLAIVKANQATVEYLDIAPAAPNVLPHVTVRP